MLLGSKLLRKVWNQWNFFRHANTRNIVNCCVRLHVAVSVSCRVFQRHAKAQSVSYRESDSFALTQNFLKNLFGTKSTVSVDSDTILYYKIFRFFSLRFFYSSVLSVFDIKIKIECKGDQYIIMWKLEITKIWVGATMMGEENAITPTLCTALVSRDRWSKHSYQNPSERRPKCECSNCIL